MPKGLVLVFFIFMNVWLAQHPVDWGFTPEQAIQIVKATLPDAQVALVYYNRDIRESLPGELPVGTRVRFEATNAMAIGRLGTVEGVIVGYMFTSPPNIKPQSYMGAFNRAEWPEIRFIVDYFFRDPCPPDVLHCEWLAHETTLAREQFEVIG